MTDDTLDPDKLKELAALMAQLPREIDPPAEAWQGISNAIESSRNPVATVFWQKPVFLAAAAMLLVATSSLVTVTVLRESGDDVRSKVASQVESEPQQMNGTSLTLAEFTKQENDYISAANRLAAILEGEQMQLSPNTIAKLRESVRVIDAAILEARRALAEDPANSQLMEMLATSYNQKVDLLRRTADMGRS